MPCCSVHCCVVNETQIWEHLIPSVWISRTVFGNYIFNIPVVSLNHAVALRVVVRSLCFFPFRTACRVRRSAHCKKLSPGQCEFNLGPKTEDSISQDCSCHGLVSCVLQLYADFKIGEVVREYENIFVHSLFCFGHWPQDLCGSSVKMNSYDPSLIVCNYAFRFFPAVDRD